MKRDRHIAKFHEMLQKHLAGKGVGILATVGQEQLPHATVMATMASPSLERLITITSPDSQKVINILENPKVEWMFADTDGRRVLYLRGVVRVIQEMDEVEEAWGQLFDKSRAFFLCSKSSPGMRFLILETQVQSIEYRLPRKNRAFKLPLTTSDTAAPRTTRGA
jgi:general stress protein 26